MFSTVLIKFQFSSCCMHVASCVWSSHIQCTYSSPSNTYLAIHLLQASTCLLFICFCIILAASYTLSLCTVDIFCVSCMLLFYHIKLSTQLSFRWCNWYCMICSHFNIGGHPILSVNTQLILWLHLTSGMGPGGPFLLVNCWWFPCRHSHTYICLLLFAILLQTTGDIVCYL